MNYFIYVSRQSVNSDIFYAVVHLPGHSKTCALPLFVKVMSDREEPVLKTSTSCMMTHRWRGTRARNKKVRSDLNYVGK